MGGQEFENMDKLGQDQCQENKPRKTRKRRRQIKHPSPPHWMLWTHLAGRINEKMTLEWW